jgi:filamentous hemagglutinin family protein
MVSNGPAPQMVMRILQRLLLSNVLVQSILLAVSWAQITLDGSLGPRGPLTGPNYRIDANMGQIRGSNLFQSFGQFNVRPDESATFAGPNTIVNIVSRVTGGQRSLIDGPLRSEILGANLYLLNPSGVMFGPKASLEVSGSFHVSTADFLRFADGAKFFANLGQESVLTVAPPAAFGFMGSTPAAITIRGSSLQVPEGKALSVVGGDITIVGNGPLTADSVSTLGAPSGRMQLASVASPGEVVFSPLELAPDLQVDSFTRLGRLDLSRGASLDVSGDGAGTVLLRGGHLLLDRSFIHADNLGDLDGAGLGVDLRIAGDAVIGNGSLITAESMAAGRARDLQMTVENLTLTGGAAIDTSSSGAGRGGQLIVAASSAISIAGRDSEGNPSGLFSNTFTDGDAGRVSISAAKLTINDGLIQAATDRDSRGNAGNIEVRVGTLTLTGGAQIDSRTGGSGRGGDLTVAASSAISIAGRDSEGNPSGLFSQTEASGNAGRLFVSAPTLSIDDGIIRSNTLGGGNAGSIDVRVERLTLTGGAQIFSGTGIFQLIDGVPTVNGIEGPGHGGDLTVVATESILISGRGREGLRSGIFSTAQFGTGAGGDLHIQANSIELRDGGTISANSTSDGAAGTLRLQVGETFRSENGRVTTAAERAGGGAIALTAGRLVQLMDSEITTTVHGGVKDAGNITLDPQFVILENSEILARADAGRGGNIRIGAGVFLADPTSSVDASASRGINGTVDIRAPVTSLSGTLAPLPQAFVSAAALLPARCAARLSGGHYSSLVLGGRDGLPLDPGGVLPSPLVLDAQLMADPAVTGEHGRQTPPARLALLGGADKVLPRMRGAHLPGGTAAVLNRGCPK